MHLLRRVPDRYWYLLFLAALCFSHIHQGTLGPDGIRYAHIAQTILTRNDWWHLYDEFKDAPYGNKPPLLFWLVAVVFDSISFSTFAARIVPVLFVFVAMLLLYRLVRRHFDEISAVLAVGLFSLNAQFFRAVLDLNFECFVICGGVLCLSALLDFAEGRQKWLTFAGGLLFLLVAKPPFILFPIGILGLVALGRRDFFPLRMLCGVMFPVAAYLIFLRYQSTELRAVSFENQLQQPFQLSHSWSTNLLKWLRTFFFYYAPLSWVGLIGLFAWIRKRSFSAVEWTLLLWLLPIIPIVLIVDVRGAYLLLPLLSLSVIAARFLRSSIEVDRLRRILRPTAGIAAVSLLLLPMLGVRFHGSDEFWRFFQSYPQYLSAPLQICVDGNDGPPSLPRMKRLQMLLQLHLQFSHAAAIPVYTSNTLPLGEEQRSLPVIANASCRANLEQLGVQGDVLDERKGVTAWRVREIPVGVAAKQISYLEFKAQFGPYD